MRIFNHELRQLVKHSIGVMPSKKDYKPQLTAKREWVLGKGRRVVRSGAKKYELIYLRFTWPDAKLSVYAYNIHSDTFVYMGFTLLNITQSVNIFVDARYLLDMLNTFKGTDVLDIEVVDNTLQIKYDKNIATFKGLQPDDTKIYSISKS